MATVEQELVRPKVEDNTPFKIAQKSKHLIEIVLNRVDKKAKKEKKKGTADTVSWRNATLSEPYTDDFESAQGVAEIAYWASDKDRGPLVSRSHDLSHREMNLFILGQDRDSTIAVIRMAYDLSVPRDRFIEPTVATNGVLSMHDGDGNVVAEGVKAYKQAKQLLRRFVR